MSKSKKIRIWKFKKISYLKIRIIVYTIFFVSAAYYFVNSNYRTLTIPLVDSVKTEYCKLKLPKTHLFIQNDSKSEINVTKKETDDFYLNLATIVEKAKYNEYKKFFNAIHKSSPESFYVIQKFSKKQPEEFELATKNWTTRLNNESAAILVHEFTHSAQYPCFLNQSSCKRFSDFETIPYDSLRDINGFNYENPDASQKTAYWIFDKAYSIDISEDKLFAFEDIPEELPTMTPLDKRDNEEGAYSSQDFSLMLGEINAYTKSSRIIREMNCSQITKRVDKYFYAQNLARQLVHLGQYIEFAKRSYPSTYNYLIENKTIPFTTMRLEALAREEIGIVLKTASNKDKINTETSPDGIKFNLDLFNKKQAAIDEFYADSKINNIKDVIPARDELKQNNINLDITTIN